MRLIPLLAGLAISATAEAQSIDEGTFSIRRSGREIGREEFVIQPGRQGVPSGSTVISRVRLPAVAATYTQESVVERRPDGSFANLVITYQSAQSSGRVIAETARNVLRIHTATGGKEAIREVPAPEHLIGLADSAFALYALVADLASEEGTRMTGVYPQSGRRLTFIARREGDAQEGTRIIMAGEITGTIWLDHSGHLTRIRFPESDLEIVRLRR